MLTKTQPSNDAAAAVQLAPDEAAIDRARGQLDD